MFAFIARYCSGVLPISVATGVAQPAARPA